MSLNSIPRKICAVINLASLYQNYTLSLWYVFLLECLCMEDSKKVDLENSQLNSLKSESDSSSPILLYTPTVSPHFFSSHQPVYDEIKKIKRSAVNGNEQVSLNKISKLTSEIEQIAANFLNLIEGKYELKGSENYKSELTIKISPLEEITLIVDNLPRYYRKIAQIILGDKYHVTELVEYFIKQNYNWDKQGKFDETLIHYLITLPDSIQALNKFQLSKQESLIDQKRDRKGYSPLESLTELYVNNFNNIEFYKNLKASFEIILDYDSIYEESLSGNSESDVNTNSSLNIMIFNRDKALRLDNHLVVKNYLEILALMCQHTTEPEMNEEVVRDSLKEYKSNEDYLAWFEQYCKFFAEKDQELFSDAKNTEVAENKNIM